MWRHFLFFFQATKLSTGQSKQHFTLNEGPKRKPTLEEINKLIAEVEATLQDIEQKRINPELKRPDEKTINPTEHMDEETKHNLAILVEHWKRNGLDPSTEFSELMFRKGLRDLKRIKFELENPWK